MAPDKCEGVPDSLGLLGRLPLELRREIYEYIIFPLRTQPSGYVKWWRTDLEMLPYVPPELSLNQVLKDEAAVVFYRHIFLNFHTHDVRISDTFFTDLDTLSTRSKITKLDLETSTELRYDQAEQWSFDKIYPEQELQHLSMYKIQRIRAAFPNLKLLSLRIWIRFNIEDCSEAKDGSGALELLREVLSPVLKGVETAWISLGAGGAYQPPSLKRTMNLGDHGGELVLFGCKSGNLSRPVLYTVDPCSFFEALRLCILRHPDSNIREDTLVVVRPDSQVLKDIEKLCF